MKEGEQEVEEEAEEELKGVMNNSVREQDVAQQVVAFGCRCTCHTNWLSSGMKMHRALSRIEKKTADRNDQGASSLVSAKKNSHK